MVSVSVCPHYGAMKHETQETRRTIVAAVNAAPLVLALAALLTIVLAGCAGTPPIADSTNDGNGGAGAIASREIVEIDGTRQGVVIRGHDRDAPVMLWLAGGPGGSELGWTTRYLGELEKDVVFVNWDQPGVGMSYRAADWDTVTVEDFVDATIAMSEYLIDRFGTDRIILVGHSWGSIIGLQAVDRRPDLYSAYVGVGQQINSRENDRLGYEMVIEKAALRGDNRVIEKLSSFGPPPYSAEEGKNYLYLFQKVHVYSPHPSPEPSFTAMLFPKEYTLGNSINMLRGLSKGVANVYPQLAELDFEASIPAVEVPTFFFTGRYDETTVQDIAYRYFQSLEAPHKEFVWFERSGHNAPYQEPQRFVREMRERVLTHISDERETR